jgi:hypothetical protein
MWEGTPIIPPLDQTPGAAVVMVMVVPVGAVATAQLPLTPVAPTTPEMTIYCPATSPWADAVVIVGFVVLVTAVIPPPTEVEIGVPTWDAAAPVNRVIVVTAAIVYPKK